LKEVKAMNPTENPNQEQSKKASIPRWATPIIWMLMFLLR
jgi:hypothetical protein